ncbi:MAG: ABC transporter permease [Candidatus Methanofastidiosia archaeon]|jgi:putative ABC transport system permease protein
MTKVLLAWRNILRNKRRTTITASAIIVGVAMMVIVNGIITGMLDRTIMNSVELETGHIKALPPGYHEKSDLMPVTMHITNYQEVMDLIGTVKGVKLQSPRIKAGGQLQIGEESTPVIINGINPELDLKIRDLKSRIGEGEYVNTKNSVMIGESLAERLNITVGQEVVLSSVASDGTPVFVPCTVESIFNTGFSSYDNSMVFLTLDTAQELLKIGHANVTEIVIMADTPEHINTVTASVSNTLKEHMYQYEVFHWEDLAPELAQFAQMEKSMSFLFLSIVIIVAAIGILNTMLMAVYERVKEVGVMAAFGYKRRDILGLFVLEGLTIGVIGAVLGCILGLGINYYLSVVGINFSGAEVVEFMEARIYTRLSVKDVVYPFFFAVGIALLAALYPAYKASRLEPVEALRHV